MKYFKTLSLTVISLILMSSFCGCERLGTELSELMIIQGIGIDVTDSGYKATVEILNNEQSGSPSGEGGSDMKTKVYFSEGATLSEALRNVTEKSGSDPLFSHARIVVLSEEAARRNIGDVLDFFERDYNSRVTMLLCVAKEMSAYDIINASLPDDVVKSEILEKILEKSTVNSLTPRVRILDAVNIVREETSSLYIPAVTIEKNGEKESYKLDGSALFNEENEFQKYLDDNTTEGLVYLNGKIEKGYITTKLPDGSKALFLIVGGKTKYKIDTTGNELVYNVTVDVKCDLNEVGGNGVKDINRMAIEDMKAAVAAVIAKKGENAVTVLKQSDSSDALRYGRRLFIKDYKYYYSVEKDWKRMFSEAKTVINVNVTIRRVGEESYHGK